jgi:hypothetical protein
LITGDIPETIPTLEEVSIYYQRFIEDDREQNFEAGARMWENHIKAYEEMLKIAGLNDKLR